MDYIILGNGPSLSCVNWDSLRNTTLNIAGINRSYFAYNEHDVLFLQDPVVVQELFDAGWADEDIQNFNIITTSYFSRRLQRDRQKNKVTSAEFSRIANLISTNKIKVVRKSSWAAFSPFTVINLLGYLTHIDNRHFKTPGGKGKQYQDAVKIKFYLAGFDLKHDADNNHFWQDIHEDASRLSGSGGSNRRQLTRQFNHMKRVKARMEYFNFELISVTPKSKINKLIPYVPIQQVIEQHRKRK